MAQQSILETHGTIILVTSIGWSGAVPIVRWRCTLLALFISRSRIRLLKTSPANASNGINTNSLTLAWEENIGAQYYEYCINTSASCSSWVNVGTNRTAALAPLAGGETYYWQVRATGLQGTTYADGAEGAFWSFTTFDPSLLTESNYIPLVAN